MTQPATITKIINGFDAAALQGAVEGISQSPETGMTRWTVRSAWKGGTRISNRIDGCEIGGQRVARRHTIECDEPHEVFGADDAANPQELLLAAVGSCMSVIYALNAASRDIPIHRLEIELTAELDLRGPLGLDPAVPPGFREVECKVHINAEATDEQLEELHQSVLRLSANYYNLTTAIPMNARLMVER